MAFYVSRREFLDALAVGAAGLAVGTTAKSYARIAGSNDRLNFALIGLNGRGYAHLSSLKANRSAARISHICDVDGNILKKFADAVQRETGEAPAVMVAGRAPIRAAPATSTESARLPTFIVLCLSRVKLCRVARR